MHSTLETMMFSAWELYTTKKKFDMRISTRPAGGGRLNVKVEGITLTPTLTRTPTITLTLTLTLTSRWRGRCRAASARQLVENGLRPV